MIFFIVLCIVAFVIYRTYKWIKSKEEEEAKKQIEKQAEEQNDWQKLHYIKTKELYEANKEFYGDDIGVKSLFFFVTIVFMGLIVYTYIKDIKPVFDYINHTIEIENSEEDK